MTAASGTATLTFGHEQAGPVQVWVQSLLEAKCREILPPTELSAGPKSLTLPVGELQPGLYLLRVQSGKQQGYARLQIIP